MCGIVGYVGEQAALPIIIKGLRHLEYRGYDSWGVGLIDKGKNSLFVETEVGRIGEASIDIDIGAQVGISHTRWATHGGVTKFNAHPHVSCNGEVAVVHNGVLTNYQELREELEEEGHTFTSDTDTECIAHLIEKNLHDGQSMMEATRQTVLTLQGSFAFAAIVLGFENQIVFAKNRSPLLIGFGDGENFLGSGEVAFLEHTKKLFPIEDMSYGRMTKESVEIFDAKTGQSLDYEITISKWSITQTQKGGYKHYMLKEIHEQPPAIQNTLEFLSRDELLACVDLLNTQNEILITACGTSFHSALVGEYLFERIAKIRARAIIPAALETKSISKNSVIIAVSQSGETADVISVLDYVKAKGARIVSLVNNFGTQIPRMSEMILYTKAGPEIGVAATKTFTSQVAAFTKLAFELGKHRGTISHDKLFSLENELSNLPQILKDTIRSNELLCKTIGERIRYKPSMFFLGTAATLPVAMEGALKIKEISYIHAEAYNAAESKHGPIALLDKGFPVVFIAASDESSIHLLGNIREMGARGAYKIVLHYGKKAYEKVADVSIVIPPMINSELMFIPFSIVLQMIAYYCAAGKIVDGEKIDPDKPRNLAKSVTVQ